MERPNILFILIDDLGWRDLACYGSTFYETPHLDALAAQGMRFTQAYASCPVCSPTRASILTGRYPARLGLTNYIPGEARGRLLEAPYIKHLPAGETTVAEALRRAGYRTYHVGKWHLGDQPYWPENFGFGVNVGGCHWGMPHNGYFSPWGIPTLPDGPEGQYLTDRLTDEAIRLMREGGDRPFFMFLCYYAVHVPIQAPAPLVERFKKKAEDLGLDRVEALQEGEHFPCEHKKHLRVVRRLVQSDPTYAAMVYRLDENVGRLMEALEELGLAQNTAVFFTSDNGGLATAEGSPTCNLPLSEGKGWVYEGGTREVLIARWRSTVPAGAVCDVPVTSTDFFPTFLEMAGLEPMPEQHCDGVSILPLLEGRGRIERDAIFWHYPHYGNQGGTPASSVRCGGWKLIEFFEDGRLELYNLRHDVSETRNLAADEPTLREELHRRLKDWREAVEAKLPRPNPKWQPR